MPLTLNDIMAAVAAADTRFTNRQDAGFAIALPNAGNVNVIFGQVGTRYDYGLPNMYILPANLIPALTQWWQARHPNTGIVLPPQLKAPGVWAINLQWQSTGGSLFNFHVAVPAPAVVAPQVLAQRSLDQHLAIHHAAV